MIYLIIILLVLLLGFALLIWLRKVQFDAVHRNFLDLVDLYGGKIVRSGFAIRPRYSGVINGESVSISISAEKKSGDKPRTYYLSVYLKSVSGENFTVMSRDWLEGRDHSRSGKSFTSPIADNRYLLEVSDKKLLRKLNRRGIEASIKQMDPFAYVLVSRRGVILERVSSNLIQDTEATRIQQLIEGAFALSALHPPATE